MALTVTIYYHGEHGSAKKFAEEMVSSGIVEEIKAKSGNLRYDYFMPLNDPETVLLIDSWENQQALDEHHASPTMSKIMKLRDKYNLHMEVERYVEATPNDEDEKFIRK